LVCSAQQSYAANVISFESKVEYPAGLQPKKMAAGDINGDGKSDIVVTNNGSKNVSVLFGRGDGTFEGKTDFTTATMNCPCGIDAGDINGDGRDEVAVTNFLYSGNINHPNI
jgi:hypothetical protein